jgi:hypothetical protein
MNLDPERRNLKRQMHMSVVALEERQSGRFIYGQMKNMTADGACLESDYPIEPGTIVNVAIDKLPYKTTRKKNMPR